MPSRGSGKGKPRAVPDAVRRAVERTVQSTLGSAEVTRERAQELVDDVVRMAEQSAARAGRGVREAGQRPAVAANRVRDALHDLRTATERLAERVAQLETQLEEQLGVTPKRGSRKAAGTTSKRTTKRTTAAASKPKRAAGSTAKRSTAAQAEARDRSQAEARDRSQAEALDRSQAEALDRSEAEGRVDQVPAGFPLQGLLGRRPPHVRVQTRIRRRALRLMGRRVLITGVAGFWGTELARCLERSPEVEYIAGLDVRPPAADLARTEFIRADIRNPLISKLLPQTRVDTVVHCDVLLVPEPGKARGAAARHQRDRLAATACRM